MAKKQRSRKKVSKKKASARKKRRPARKQAGATRKKPRARKRAAPKADTNRAVEIAILSGGIMPIIGA